MAKFFLPKWAKGTPFIIAKAKCFSGTTFAIYEKGRFPRPVKGCQNLPLYQIRAMVTKDYCGRCVVCGEYAFAWSGDNRSGWSLCQECAAAYPDEESLVQYLWS